MVLLGVVGLGIHVTSGLELLGFQFRVRVYQVFNFSLWRFRCRTFRVSGAKRS